MFVDSTLLIDLLRDDNNAISFLKKIKFSPLYTSEINIFELIQGAYMSDEQVQENVNKITTLASKLTVLKFDRAAAIKAGMISGKLTKKGKKIGEVDCLIAGIALANGVTKIITKNKKHFEKIPEIQVIGY
jgi:tRNA(fMet)-specific endonuclease VapC